MQKNSSQRLQYQQIAEVHFPFFKEFLECPEQTRYLPLGKPYPQQDIITYFKKRMEHWDQKNFGSFVFYTLGNRGPVGYCGLEHVRDTAFIDIRYGINKEFWGQGYGREAAGWCLEVGFHQLGLPIIYGAAEHENIPSLNILQGIGLRPTDNVDFYGDVVKYFKILKEEFLIAPLKNSL